MSEKFDSRKFDKVINNNKPVLVDFFATWCGPCHIMNPIIADIAKEEKEFDVIELDIDKSPEIAARYNVMSVPTFIIFKDGEDIERMMGAMPKELLLEKIRKAIK